MSSCLGVLRESNVRAESPAKLFARMKSRVEKESVNGGCRGTLGKHLNFSDELKENHWSSSMEAEALTLSPVSSPTRPPEEPDSSELDMPPLVSGVCFMSPQNRKKKEANKKSSIVDAVGGQRRSDLPADIYSPRMTRKRKLAVNNKLVFSDAASPPKEQRTEHRCDPIPVTKRQTIHNQLKQSAADCPALMSPLKALAYLRQKDGRSKQDTLKKSCSETLRPLDKGLCSSARGLTPPEVESHSEHSSPSDSEVKQIVSPSTLQSAGESPEEVVLLEDPLLVNSPKLVIPKKSKALMRKDWLPSTTFLSESEIYLTKWLPRRNHKGMFVDGLRREDNSPWNTNIIVERVSNSVVKTVSGRVYILCGKMATNRQCEFPRWFLKKFSVGFPPHWKELLDKFLSENSQTEGKARHSSSSKAVVKKKPVKSEPRLTPHSAPPVSASAGVSRSGRVLRAPLEYWKGGRVTVDAQMNVTIYECYDTSVVKPNTSSPETSLQSKAFLPSDEGNKHSGSASDQGSSVKRRVAPPRRRRKAVSEPLDKPSSSEERSRQPRGRQRQSDTQSQSEPESQVPKKPTRGAKKAQTKPKRRAQILSSSEDQTENDASSPDFVTRKKRSVKAAARTRKTTDTSKKPQANKRKPPPPPPEDIEAWTEAEMQRLQQAVSSLPKHVAGYWAKVATMVGSRTAEECHNKRTSFMKTQSSAAKPKRSTKKKAESAKESGAGQALITAKPGTLRNKQQVRQFLENMPTENTDDVFSCDFMQKKKFELPSMSKTKDLDFTLNDLEPTTPKSNVYMEAKTPQCLPLTPGMFGSPSRNLDDKYVFQLQKRMKKSQFNVCKPSAKNFTPPMSDKRQMRKCADTENGTFLVWEMFPEQDGPQSDSSTQQDFYFSDSD